MRFSLDKIVYNTVQLNGYDCVPTVLDHPKYGKSLSFISVGSPSCHCLIFVAYHLSTGGRCQDIFGRFYHWNDTKRIIIEFNVFSRELMTLLFLANSSRILYHQCVYSDRIAIAYNNHNLTMLYFFSQPSDVLMFCLTSFLLNVYKGKITNNIKVC